MAKIYTRTGDDGTTGLYGGPRVRKNDPRIVAIGEVDELNAALGLALAEGLPDPLSERLTRQQHELFGLGAELASPDADAMGTRMLSDAAAVRLEREIDELTDRVPPLRVFVLPGGTPASARLHLARCVCRRAERALLDLDDAGGAVSTTARVYLNRLSDFLFAAARFANVSAGVPEPPWDQAVSRGEA